MFSGLWTAFGSLFRLHIQYQRMESYYQKLGCFGIREPDQNGDIPRSRSSETWHILFFSMLRPCLNVDGSYEWWNRSHSNFVAMVFCLAEDHEPMVQRCQLKGISWPWSTQSETPLLLLMATRNPKANHLGWCSNPVNKGDKTTNLNWWVCRSSGCHQQ